MSTHFKTLLSASCTAIACAVFVGPTDAAASEYQCRKLDSSLRIAVEVKKAGHTLPCEVIAEDDRGERAVLFSAQFDREYCPARIEKTKDELEQEGWQCELTSDVNVVRPADAPDIGVVQSAPLEAEAEIGQGGPANENRREVAAVRQCRQGNAERRIQIEIENPASGTPCELIYWSEDDSDGPGELLWRAEHDAGFCPRRLDFIVDKWVGEGWSCESGDLQTAALQAPDDADEAGAETIVDGSVDAARTPDDATSAADRTLQAIITADAERIGDWMDVEPAIEIAARGDLNDDGSDDAVVFLTYQSDQAAYRQYLMSYLVADDGYELASVKLLTGVNPPPDHARVQQIDDGVIWLAMPAEEDTSSAASTGYRLENRELVEVAPEGDIAPSE